MKSTKLKLGALGTVLTLGLFAFTTVFSGSIKGKITPSAAAMGAMAISGTDTVRALIDNGSFSINNVKAGTYKLVIQALPPYKNFEKEGVMVADDMPTDVGEINLQK
ncbi:MAG: carboxypeptidase regulatory-like domain-containing protein [Bacteroidetes bacterium]|nr:MAG: carboxypeptidase regulatory-like domain-containing protein [Bacteroidota bacterium]